MKFYYKDLIKYPSNEPFRFKETINLTSELQSKDPEEILNASDFEINGYAFSDLGDVIISANVKGSIVVPSSRTLEPVELPLDFDLQEIYVLSKAAEKRYDESEVVFVIDEDAVMDMNSAIIDNIILRIPMQVLSEDEKAGKGFISGNDWEIISSDDYNNQKAENKNVDPRLEKLKNYFNEDNSK